MVYILNATTWCSLYIFYVYNKIINCVDKNLKQKADATFWTVVFVKNKNEERGKDIFETDLGRTTYKMNIDIQLAIRLKK